MWLRLERIGRRVSALCSSDGEEWLTVGHVEFPADDPFEVGMLANGNICRWAYQGAFKEGSAIGFESFELWAREQKAVSRPF